MIIFCLAVMSCLTYKYEIKISYRPWPENTGKCS